MGRGLCCVFSKYFRTYYWAHIIQNIELCLHNSELTVIKSSNSDH